MNTGFGRGHPRFGARHGISKALAADAGEHTVCLTATNSGGGGDKDLGCRTIAATNPLPPATPLNATASAGYSAGIVTWTAPQSDGGAPWTKFVVTARPGGKTVTVGPSATTATVPGLKPGSSYTFTVQAVNAAGSSAAATTGAVVPLSGPAPQTTPAPISTSRYIRNIRGASASDLATMRAEGAADAAANPSGHRYLILLDIGGQSQYNGGVVLSATTRFVSYADLVKDVRAYLDGYASRQRATAPILVAVGTNNDMDVTAATGTQWGGQVVNPLVSYARKYAGIQVAGANDIEPGFSGNYGSAAAWLKAYLASTKARFVFNGSADGCSSTATSHGCNNGWTMSGLYNLAAGAAPSRITNLPQVYNYTMADQWKYISLTGLGLGQPRIAFGGPLTEYTACAQAHSCGSITGNQAWQRMWANLHSQPSLRVGSLPFSTDLRIDS